MSGMTKQQARAILALSNKVLAACNQCELHLQNWPELENAKAYWLAQLRSIASGSGYGSMPVNRADDVVNL